MKAIFLYLMVLFFVSSSAISQTSELAGTIVSFNKYPLKGVTVKAKKSKQETITDENGKFTISIKKKDLLQFEAKGFEKYSYRSKEGESSIRVNLIYQDTKKNRELVIENGYITLMDLDYGLEHLSVENNVFGNFVDVFDAIHYVLPSLTFFEENGTRKVMMRGNKTVQGSSAALMIVNGVPVDDISYINPYEIVSIKQLSASQSAIYGARAGNGVIVIQTK